MRFRPANISLINRRHYLPRLLLILSSRYNDKNHPSDLQILTGSHHINFRVDGDSLGTHQSRRGAILTEGDKTQIVGRFRVDAGLR